MALALPAKLKTPDLQRFALRAAQLEKARPIVTYWCEYYLLQHILERQLHATDEECTQYAVGLMDKLEHYKAANAQNDAVIDDVAAKAYVESFALETFERADGSQRTNTVKAQTADTFQAAMTFMDLLTVWGPLDAEIAAKKKYAKFHAVRIVKAIRAGQDPNETNPVSEPAPAPVDVDILRDIEAELKDLEKPNDAGVYQQPTVESISESRVPSRPPSILQVDPAPAPVAVSATPTEPRAEPDTSPIVDPAGNANSRAGSIGGGYFPNVPTSPANETVPVDPSISTPRGAFASADAAAFYNPSQAPSVPTERDLGIGTRNRPSRPAPDEVFSHSASGLPASPLPLPSQISVPATPAAPFLFAAPPAGGYRTDDEAVMAAQKHAKWAISALNFEDVNTAVKELRIALQSLGAG